MKSIILKNHMEYELVIWPILYNPVLSDVRIFHQSPLIKMALVLSCFTSLMSSLTDFQKLTIPTEFTLPKQDEKPRCSKKRRQQYFRTERNCLIEQMRPVFSQSKCSKIAF